MIPWSTYSSEEIKAVWDKAEYIDGVILYRKDCYGYTITDSEYMHERSVFGWFIDHIVPLKEGGSDDVDNLIPVNVYNYGKDHRKQVEKVYCRVI